MSPASKKKTDWSAAFSKPESAPRSLEPVQDTPEAEKKPAPVKRGPRGPYNIAKVEKKAQTYRLTQDAIDLIDQAKAEAAAEGNKLTNDDAVIQAIRGYWGKRRRRR